MQEENSDTAWFSLPIAFESHISESAGMPSPKLLVGRHSLIGACYSVTATTRAREPLFRDCVLAQITIDGITDCVNAGSCSSLAWVVMPDHVHWLLMLERGTLGSCMQRFKSMAARAINGHRAIARPVWQRGYYEHRLRSDEDMLAQARYVVANPVRRGLVGRIEDYPYWWCRYIRSSQDLF